MHSYLRTSQGREPDPLPWSPEHIVRPNRPLKRTAPQQRSSGDKRNLQSIQHMEQGHSPDWLCDANYGELTPQELGRARTRFQRNKGCLYEASPEKAQRKPSLPVPVIGKHRDWMDGQNHPYPAGGTLWKMPGTLKGVLAADARLCRREGWGGLPSRRDYQPVYEPSCEVGPGNQLVRLEKSVVKQRRKKKAETLRAERNIPPPPPQYGTPPSCYPENPVTRGVGTLGRIGALEPSGWWVSRAPPVLTAPHAYHCDTR